MATPIPYAQPITGTQPIYTAPLLETTGVPIIAKPITPENFKYHFKFRTPQAANNTKPMVSYHTDYNDPLALNSVADILLNTEALRKRYGDTLATNVLLRGTVTPIIGAVDLLWNNVLKPIGGSVANGDGLWSGIKTSAYNTLVNAGETLDIVNNVVKGAIFEGSSGVNKALGVSTSTGRTNYDWDTGSTIADFALEVLLDPTTYFTLGGSAAVKGSTSIGKGVAKAVSKSVPDLSTKAASKIAKRLTKGTVRDIVGGNTVKALAKSEKQTISLLNKWNKSKKLWNTSISGLTTAQIKAIASEVSSTVTKTVLDNSSKVGFKTGKVLGALDYATSNIPLKAVGITAGLTPSAYAAKGLKRIFETSANKALEVQDLKDIHAVLGFSDRVDEALDTLEKMPPIKMDMADAITDPRLNDIRSYVLGVHQALVTAKKTNTFDSVLNTFTGPEFTERMLRAVKTLKQYAASNEAANVLLKQTKETYIALNAVKQHGKLLDLKRSADSIQDVLRDTRSNKSRFEILEKLDGIRAQAKYTKVPELESIAKTLDSYYDLLAKQNISVSQIRDAETVIEGILARAENAHKQIQELYQQYDNLVTNQRKVLGYVRSELSANEIFSKLNEFDTKIAEAVRQEDYIRHQLQELQGTLKESWIKANPEDAVKLEQDIELRRKYFADELSEAEKELIGERTMEFLPIDYRVAYENNATVQYYQRILSENLPEKLRQSRLEFEQFHSSNAVQQRAAQWKANRAQMDALAKTFAEFKRYEKALRSPKPLSKATVKNLLFNSPAFTRTFKGMDTKAFPFQDISLFTRSLEIQAQGSAFIKEFNRNYGNFLEDLRKGMQAIYSASVNSEAVFLETIAALEASDVTKLMDKGLRKTSENISKYIDNSQKKEMQRTKELRLAADDQVKFTEYYTGVKEIVKYLDEVSGVYTTGTFTQNLYNSVNQAIDTLTTLDADTLTKLRDTLDFYLENFSDRLADFKQATAVVTDFIGEEGGARASRIIKQARELRDEAARLRDFVAPYTKTEYLNTLEAYLDQLSNLYNKQFQEADLTEVFFKSFADTGEVDRYTAYILKQSQLYNSLLLMGNESVAKIMDGILDGTAEFGKLNELLKDSSLITSESAALLTNLAARYKAYQRLLSAVFTLPETVISTNMKTSILDSFSTYAKRRVSDFEDGLPQYLLRDMFSRAEQNNYHRAAHPSSTLEDAFLRFGGSEETMTKYMKDVPQEMFHAHQSLYDSFKVKWLVEETKVRKEFSQAFPDKRFSAVYFDLETTSLNKQTGKLTQIGYTNTDSTLKKQLNIKMTQAPEDMAVVRKQGYETIEDFMRAHESGVDEVHAIQEFFEDLIALEKDTGKRVVFVGHNIESVGGFDIGMLRSRIYLTDFSTLPNGLELQNRYINFLNSHETFDTLRYIREQEGFMQYTAAQRSLLTNIFNDYYYEIAQTQASRLAQPVTAGLINSFEDLKELVKALDSSSATKLKSSLDKAIGDLRQTLKSIGDSSKKLSSVSINTGDIPIGYNISSSIAENVNAIVTHSSKKVYDAATVFNTFDIPSAAAATLFDEVPRTARKMYSAAKSISQTMDRVRNAKVLIENAESITRVGESLKQLLNDLGIKSSVPYDLLRLDPRQPVRNFATVKHLERVVRAKIIQNENAFALINKDYVKGKYKDLLSYIAENREVTAGIMDILDPSRWAEPMSKHKTLPYFQTRMSTEDFATYVKLINSDTSRMLEDVQDIFSSNPYKATFAAVEMQTPEELWRFIDLPGNISELRTETDNLRRTLQTGQDRLDTYSEYLENQTLHRTASMMYRGISEKLSHVWDSYIDTISTLYKDDRAFLDYKQALIRRDNLFAEQHVNRILNLPPVEFAAHLFHNSAGRIMFTANSYRLSTATIAKLKKVNVEVLTQAMANGKYQYIFIADKNYLEFFESLPKPKVIEDRLPADMFDPSVKIIESVREANKQFFGNPEDTLGDICEAGILSSIDKAIPAYARDLVIPIDYFEKAGWFSEIKYNQSLVGDVSLRRTVHEYSAVNPLKRYTKTYLEGMRVMDAKTQYAGVWFNDTLNINTSPLFKTADGVAMSNQQIFDIVKDSKTYVFAAIVKAPKETVTGFKVTEVFINSAKDVQLAKNLGAILIPYQNFLDLAGNINRFKALPGAVRFINYFITNTYKFGFLSSIGFITRNLLDGFIKNSINADEAFSLPKSVGHWFQTVKLYNNYKTTYKQLTEYVTRGYTQQTKLTDELIAHFFKAEGHKVPLDEGAFRTVYEFYTYGPANITKEMESYRDFVYKMGENKSVDERALLDKAGQAYGDALRMLQGAIGVQSANNFIEQTLRLSTYLLELERTGSTVEAINRVLRTHFDYSTKTYKQHILETFLPFMSFRINNYMYYLEALGKSRWVRNFAHAYKAFSGVQDNSNADAIDYQDLDRDTLKEMFDQKSWYKPNATDIWIPTSRVYHTLNMNIMLDTGVVDPEDERKELVKVIKLNPSAMDAFAMMYDPVSTLTGSLLPVFETALDSITPEAAKRFMDGDYYTDNPSEQGFLDIAPLVSTVSQRFKTLQDNQKKADSPVDWVTSILPSLNSYNYKFRQMDPNADNTNASDALKKMWYGQYKGGNYKEEYNPYTASGYKQKQNDVKFKTFEEFQKYMYYHYKQSNLSEAFNLYSKSFPGSSRYSFTPFNPESFDANASKKQVQIWYALYKNSGLPSEFNPYKYYPQYNGFKNTGQTKSMASSRPYKKFRAYYSPNNYTPSLKAIHYNNVYKNNELYNSMYTSDGVSRMAIRMRKTTLATLHYRIDDIKRMFRKTLDRAYNGKWDF